MRPALDFIESRAYRVSARVLSCRAELLYGLADRKCGVPLPAENHICRTVRLQMCLRAPGVRDEAQRQMKVGLV